MLNIKRLSFDEARILLDGCAKKSRELGIPMCSAVTDESGHLVAFDRMDGGKISSISIRMPSIDYQNSSIRQQNTCMRWDL